MSLLVYKLIIQLYQGQRNKYQQIIFPKTKQIIKLIKKLTIEGFLYGYKPIIFPKEFQFQQSFIQIYLKYMNGFASLSCLAKYHQYTLFKYISYKHLLALKHFSPFILIQSNKGILTHIEAIKYKIGGRILLICI
jgi:ribosomal protein S8